jgi:hypothetical protein
VQFFDKNDREKRAENVPLFCKDGSAGKHALQRPWNSPQMAKTAGMGKVCGSLRESGSWGF